MSGFPGSAWVLLIVAIVPGMALAIWNAARGRRLGAPASGRHRRPQGGETHAGEGPGAGENAR
ncbi:MAG: hypothetical protein F4228_09575 [Acidobacteria bacterium]|nr:hypothetical protein [Acidobacteriota bacterium]MYF14938.1 hypothetical protein [Acidobacteriota bacterium]MYI95887.1 hypothetical protein [Acidobacteriota bacterium]